jgi:hypothetical protein
MTIRLDQFVAHLAAAGDVVCIALSTFLFGPGKTYHPERHYMRGPGPKCRERRGTISP